MPNSPQQAKKRRKPAEVRRHDIIEAAMEIIRHHGVARLTTRSLSQAVGIAQPTLFLHFGTKSHVLVALVDEIQSRLRRGIEGQDLEALPPLERLKTVIGFHLGFIQQQPGIPRLLFSEELQSGDPAVRERMTELVTFFLRFLTDLIRAAQQAGEIRADIDAEAHACLLIATVQGLAFRWILSDHRFELAEQAEVITRALIEGWAPR